MHNPNHIKNNLEAKANIKLCWTMMKINAHLTQCDIVSEALMIVLCCESKIAVVILVSWNHKTFESVAMLKSRVVFQQILHSFKLNFHVSFCNWNLIRIHKSLENKSWALSDVMFKTVSYHYHHKSHVCGSFYIALLFKCAFSWMIQITPMKSFNQNWLQRLLTQFSS